MKLLVVPILVISFLFSCNDPQVSRDFPDFEANYSLNDIPEDLKEHIADCEFAITAYYGSGWVRDYRWSKIFRFKDGIWEKVEMRIGISEIDYIYPDSSEIELIFKDVVIRKPCSVNEGEKFIEQLINNHLFILEEEESILKKCSNPIGYDDGGKVVFHIIEGNKVRKLNYDNPHSHQEKDCPEVDQWNYIINIVKLFENNWYNKEH